MKAMPSFDGLALPYDKNSGALTPENTHGNKNMPGGMGLPDSSTKETLTTLSNLPPLFSISPIIPERPLLPPFVSSLPPVFLKFGIWAMLVVAFSLYHGSLPTYNTYIPLIFHS
ncbi:hypothetical protein GCM10020219_044740 [Nonomuraea dietziae]